ncbi:leucyl aminopeptidase [Mollisia scopiformis]|uniref:Peptide hydrolase n=1 Tax=Mollisia scopiformis TaxID=149040 RepID=A0A194XC52_MOLSC|nr:leucyl aminopeptidase [Mollisia scopiformis]KUJ17332.1 leucyl aminopeptidase [Mollisia scopiformis]
MKLSILSSLAWSAYFVSAGYADKRGVGQIVIDNSVLPNEPRYLIEFADGHEQWVTDTEKWALKKDGQFFMDTTNFPDLGKFRSQLETPTPKYTYPVSVSQKGKITPLLKELNKTNLQSNLGHLTTFHNRWYNSTFGEASYHWLFSKILTTIASTGAHEHGITAELFVHPWSRQNSIIVRIPGQSTSTIVVGAHQDSVNHEARMDGRAPGADDDGSGTVTILEVLRVLLSDKKLVGGKAENTLEFHWYAAEEGGMLGSQDLWESYMKGGKTVKGMLQQDMTGFWNKTIEKEKEFGLMMDVVDKPLMEYLKLIIEEYTELPWVETGCGPYCGSDHMSAIKAGYPGAFIIEGAFEYTDNHLHGVDDLAEYLDYDHMIDHAQMTLGFLYELAFAKF